MTRHLLTTLLFLLLALPLKVYSTEPIVIALDADVSAVAKEGGIAIQRGAQIAIDQINQSGGILGRPVELKVFDHRGNPARGLANLKRIAKIDNVLAVLGGVHTPVVLQELEFIHQNKILFMAPWSAGTPIIDNGYDPNFVFRVSVRDQEAGKVLVSAAKKSGISKIALILEKTGWGRSNLKSMSASAEKLGIEISTVQWINWQQKNMDAEISEIARSGAQALMLVANAPEGSVAITTLANHKTANTLPVYSHWGLAGGSFVSMAGLDTISKVNLQILQTYSFVSPSNNTLNALVVEQYQAMFDPSATAENIPGAVGVAHSFDIIHLLAAAAEQAQSINSDKIRIALENLSEHKGLVKHYQPPFSKTKHDALWSEDYFLSQYDTNGHLLPMVTTNAP